MVAFLRVTHFFVIVVVALCVPAFLVAAAVLVLFCDSGPAWACIVRAALLLCVPVAQIVCVVIASRLRNQGRRLRLVALLYVMAVVPAVVACVSGVTSFKDATGPMNQSSVIFLRVT